MSKEVWVVGKEVYIQQIIRYGVPAPFSVVGTTISTAPKELPLPLCSMSIPSLSSRSFTSFPDEASSSVSAAAASAASASAAAACAASAAVFAAAAAAAAAASAASLLALAAAVAGFIGGAFLEVDTAFPPLPPDAGVLLDVGADMDV